MSSIAVDEREDTGDAHHIDNPLWVITIGTAKFFGAVAFVMSLSAS